LTPISLATLLGVTDDLAFALQMADRADELTLRRFGALDLSVETKPDLTPVSDADRDAEQLLRSMIAEQRPEDIVVGEEFGQDTGNARSWILDPIDGTKNYIRGVPVWATLIALATRAPAQETSDIVLGVVSAPALGRRWWAQRESGAWMSFQDSTNRVSSSSVKSIADASLSFSEWNDPAWDSHGRRDAFDRLLRTCWRSRAYGDFWSHMMVAEGTVDAAIEPELFPWDMAALVPIIEEAGGAITALDGSSPMAGGNAVSSNGHLHRELLDFFGD
jgi:histidinol-phosphatase